MGGLLAVVLLLWGAPSTVEAQEIDGTYRFEVLSEDRTAIVAQGRFVLTKAPLDLDRLPERLLAAARQRSDRMARGEPRVCFAFERADRLVGDREFYGGLIPSGLSDWRRDDDQVIISTYLSADADQALRGTIVGNAMEGHVIQNDWDRRGPAVWLPFDATKVGPPTLQQCEELLQRTEVGR